MENPLEPSEVSPTAEPPPRADAPEGTDPLAPDPQPAPGAAEAPGAGLVSPEVERIGTPEGAARHIPDPTGKNRPSPVFLAVVSIVSLVADVGSKIWAEKRLEGYPGTTITVWENHLAFVLAKNRGGAWGLLQGTSENVRRPFFLLVSAAAIAFIVTLYRRLTPRQRALKWGLPLVLGGALGNVFDRIRYGHVIDFIDYHADWIRIGNEFVAKRLAGHVVTDHWPTFNVADVAICVGVGLMAVDMFTAKRHKVDVNGRTLPPPPLDLPPENPAQAPAAEASEPVSPPHDAAVEVPSAVAETKPVE